MGILRFPRAHEALSAFGAVEGSNRSLVANGKQPLVAAGTIPGLANLGNTCFANSVLQCVFNTPGWLPEACAAFAGVTNVSGPQAKKALLGKAFHRLAMEYGSNANGSLPRNNQPLRELKDAIAAVDSQYAGYQQQDAYEFLGCLLEGLEDGFTALYRTGTEERPKQSPQLIRAICGITTLTKRTCHACQSCFEVDKVTDTALRLPLLSAMAQFDADLRAKEEATPISLNDLWAESRKPEDIEGYDCDNCRANAKRCGQEHQRSKITQHAGVLAETKDVLIVVLYRFGHFMDDRGDFKPIKVKRQVACPTDLNLDNRQYSLYGVVSHIGSSLSSGHYVSAVKSTRDGNWYECNDEYVRPLQAEALYNGGSVTSVTAGADPYILFYRKKVVEDVIMEDVGKQSSDDESPRKDNEWFAEDQAVVADEGSTRSPMSSSPVASIFASEEHKSAPEVVAQPPATPAADILTEAPAKHENDVEDKFPRSRTPPTNSTNSTNSTRESSYIASRRRPRSPLLQRFLAEGCRLLSTWRGDCWVGPTLPLTGPASSQHRGPSRCGRTSRGDGSSEDESSSSRVSSSISGCQTSLGDGSFGFRDSFQTDPCFMHWY